DWHMRMPITLEEHEKSRKKRIDEESVANRLLQRICLARAKRLCTRKEQHQISEGHPSDDDVEKNQIMSTPPIDGSKWIGVNSDDNHQRY
ncbi:hypothetical protein Angca_000230, partial [Angiostrongylus cantonensis]